MTLKRFNFRKSRICNIVWQVLKVVYNSISNYVKL